MRENNDAARLSGDRQVPVESDVRGGNANELVIVRHRRRPSDIENSNPAEYSGW
jgi:hypothetical protein